MRDVFPVSFASFYHMCLENKGLSSPLISSVLHRLCPSEQLWEGASARVQEDLTSSEFSGDFWLVQVNIDMVPSMKIC